MTLTKEAPPFRREERRAGSEHRLDRRRVCEIGRHGMPLTEAGDRIDRRLGSFAIRPVVATTRAPASASRTATARPMPRDALVTNAVRPCRSMGTTGKVRRLRMDRTNTINSESMPATTTYTKNLTVSLASVYGANVC